MNCVLAAASRLTRLAARVLRPIRNAKSPRVTTRPAASWKPVLDVLEGREVPATLALPQTSLPSFTATFQEIVPGGQTVTVSGEPVAGGNFLGTLNGVKLVASYCVDINRQLPLATYSGAAVTQDGTAYGTAVPNAGAISWLVTHFGASAVTADQQNALQAAIWRTEYGNGFQLDGVDNTNGAPAENTQIAPLYQNDLAALGTNTASVAAVDWISPGAAAGVTQGQPLVAVTAGSPTPPAPGPGDPGWNGKLDPKYAYDPLATEIFTSVVGGKLISVAGGALQTALRPIANWSGGVFERVADLLSFGKAGAQLPVGFTGAGMKVIDQIGERMYQAIRASGFREVPTLAARTGLTPTEVQLLKQHLFFQKQAIPVGSLPDYMVQQYNGVPWIFARFTADPEIAYAWQRALQGPLTAAQKVWFRQLANHELGEAKLISEGVPYRIPNGIGAHDLAPPQPAYDTFPGYDAWAKAKGIH